MCQNAFDNCAHALNAGEIAAEFYERTMNALEALRTHNAATIAVQDAQGRTVAAIEADAPLLEAINEALIDSATRSADYATFCAEAAQAAIDAIERGEQ